jgi:hypothetical protein
MDDEGHPTVAYAIFINGEMKEPLYRRYSIAREDAARLFGTRFPRFDTNELSITIKRVGIKP